MDIYTAGGTDMVDVFATRDWKDFADLFVDFGLSRDSKVIVSYQFNWAGDPALVATRLMINDIVETHGKATSCASQALDIICGSISSVWMGELNRGRYKIKVQYKLGNKNALKANIINFPSTEEEQNPYKSDNHTRVLQVMVMP